MAWLSSLASWASLSCYFGGPFFVREPGEAELKYMMRTAQGSVREHAEHKASVTLLAPSEIEIGERILPPDPENVAALVESYSATKQIAPLLVRVVEDDRFALIAGLSRLGMATKLQLLKVPCQLIECSDDEAIELEVRENLSRRQLHGEQRRVLYAKLVELRGGEKIYQPLPNAQPHDKAISTVAHELGVDRMEVSRAVKIEAKVTPDAKEAARDAGLIDNNSAMLEVAATTPAKQPAKVEEIKKRKPRRQQFSMRAKKGKQRRRDEREAAHL